MDTLRLGRTDINASRSGFGALPIQRISFDEAKLILKKAYHGGINFYDTARVYTDSEEKLGKALSDVRHNIFLATKSTASDKNGLLKDLETSLKLLKTDYIDIYQLHFAKELPDFDDPESLYGGLLEARKKGYIRYLGITTHRLEIALKAAQSRRFDTVQYPFSLLSSKEEIGLTEMCKENDVGFIAMKALSGGLITNAAGTFAFIRQFSNVLPIWGIQREWELDEFIGFENNPPVIDEALLKVIEREREELGGSFCRGCGYCQPCPAGIPVPTAARISFFLKRMPKDSFITDEFKEQMDRIENCTGCNHCKNNCPYGLDTPNILKQMLKEYRIFYANNKY